MRIYDIFLGDGEPPHMEAISTQNREMMKSFLIINTELATLSQSLIQTRQTQERADKVRETGNIVTKSYPNQTNTRKSG